MDLETTSGAIEGGRITHPAVRAFAPGSTGDDAQFLFRYLGVTEEKKPLASGELREQVCLKLRAADSCNTIYACWRWSPTPPSIVVSVKSNPGMTEHAECGAGGYRTISEQHTSPHRPVVGESYSFSARLAKGELTVSINGVEYWFDGLIPDDLSLRGPAGLRTDNAHLADVRFLARGVWR